MLLCKASFSLSHNLYGYESFVEHTKFCSYSLEYAKVSKFTTPGTFEKHKFPPFWSIMVCSRIYWKTSRGKINLSTLLCSSFPGLLLYNTYPMLVSVTILLSVKCFWVSYALYKPNWRLKFCSNIGKMSIVGLKFEAEECAQCVTWCVILPFHIYIIWL